MKFFSNQPTLAGTLKYDVTISSSSILMASPVTIWTVNVRTCSEKYNDWVTQQNPVANIQYDKRNPPASPIIATFASEREMLINPVRGSKAAVRKPSYVPSLFERVAVGAPQTPTGAPK